MVQENEVPVGMKRYPPEFETDAVALYRSRPGVTVASVAADLGVNTETLRSWIRAAAPDTVAGPTPSRPAPAESVVEAENRELSSAGRRAEAGARDPGPGGQVFCGRDVRREALMGPTASPPPVATTSCSSKTTRRSSAKQATGRSSSCTTYETSPSARTPPASAPAPQPAPWPPCATWPSHSCAKPVGPTSSPQQTTTGHAPTTPPHFSISEPENASTLVALGSAPARMTLPNLAL